MLRVDSWSCGLFLKRKVTLCCLTFRDASGATYTFLHFFIFWKSHSGNFINDNAMLAALNRGTVGT